MLMAFTVPPAATPATAPVVISTCGTGGAAVAKPRELAISCDGSDYLIRLRWTRWDSKGASGHGADALNDCTPDCAHGKIHDYPVHVNFWGIAAVTGHPGRQRYTHYTVTYTKSVPAGLSRRRTGTL